MTRMQADPPKEVPRFRGPLTNLALITGPLSPLGSPGGRTRFGGAPVSEKVQGGLNLLLIPYFRK